ncbi:unnamed protein product [Somion occarium]|uniref:Transmembrane protein n=1 Tax=Somion occarium TaxID=3059160 RepID=A0ABP1D9T5_9APHY
MPHKDQSSTKQKSKTKGKTRKGKGKAHPVNFAESHDKSDPSDDKPLRSSGKKKGDSESNPVLKEKPKVKKPASEIDADAIPNFIPEHGISRTTYYATPTTALIRTGVLPVITPTLGATPVATVLGTAVATASHSISSIISLPSTSAQALQDQHSTNSKRPSTVVIVILSILAAFLLFGLIAAAWVYSRPKKRSHLVPSLPILQEDYPDEKLDGDEESLFGGKERTSARPGSNGILWNWTQYPHTSMIQPKAGPDTTAPPDLPAKRQSVAGEKSSYPFKGHGVTANSATPASPPLQQLQNVITRAANRVSAMSASIYPTSPQGTHNYSGIGVAVGDASPLTADGLPVLQRSASKSSTRRHSKTTKNVRQSIAGWDMVNIPTNSKRENETTSPTYLAPTTGLSASSSGGRARVQGPYASAVSMRSSTSVGGLGPSSSRFSVTDHNPFETLLYALPPLPPVNKTEARRERDTQALTSALGLNSPPLSPQGTLYPDDSITLAGDRRRSRALSHNRMRSQVTSPTVDATARLGNLMLEDFQSSFSLVPPRNAGQSSSGNAPPRTKPAIKKRAEDKPPRVPSPPPMPSLAQMAMEHGNPGDYADYRSPTYSIYGFYEMDRKSTDRKSIDRKSKLVTGGY